MAEAAGLLELLEDGDGGALDGEADPPNEEVEADDAGYTDAARFARDGYQGVTGRHAPSWRPTLTPMA